MYYQNLMAIERALSLTNQGRAAWLVTQLGSAYGLVDYRMQTTQAEPVDDDGNAYRLPHPFKDQRQHADVHHSPLTTVHVSQGRDHVAELLLPDSPTQTHLEVLHATLLGQPSLVRLINLNGSPARLRRAEQHEPLVQQCDQLLALLVQPALRLVMAGQIRDVHRIGLHAHQRGFEVIWCRGQPGTALAEDTVSPDTPTSDLSFPMSDLSFPMEVQHAEAAHFLAGGGGHRRTLVLNATSDASLAEVAKSSGCFDCNNNPHPRLSETTHWLDRACQTLSLEGR